MTIELFEILRTVKKGDYLYAVVPEHPRASSHGYVLLHRVIVENAIGRVLESFEVVHHKNHDKKDNRLENLEVMTATEHSFLHAKKGRNFVSLTCPECGCEFSRERRQTHFAKGGDRTFCSRSCSGKSSRAEQLLAA
jgi:hypothetical protein